MRLLEVLAGHAAVAVENAQPVRVCAPRGGKRDRAARVRSRARAASSLDEILERVVELTATCSGHRARRSGSRAATGCSRRASCTAIRAPSAQRRAAPLRRRDGLQGGSGPAPSPFVLGPTRVVADRERPARSRRVVRARAARRRRRARLHRRGASRRRASASASCGCSAASRTRRSWRSRTRATTKGSSRRSSRPSRRSRTRSRRTTSTRRRTRAGSPISHCASAACSASTTAR